MSSPDNQNPSPHPTSLDTLAHLWAKKYTQDLLSYAWEQSTEPEQTPEQSAQKLLDSLRFASAQAWTQTETLLAEELPRHRIHSAHIDPWRFAEDSRQLFEKAVSCYRTKMSPERFSVEIAPVCGQIRSQHTRQDPRILGFLSMQFHYTGQLLLQKLDTAQRGTFAAYLKVMDDHLYMPLQRAYDAAAQLSYDSPSLKVVQQLLPLTTQIAETICAETAQLHPAHQCRHGSLHDLDIRVSSVRDVEMFQVYLCLCLMEGSLASVQQELFPLCAMLYPPLQVSWHLVRHMLEALDHAVQDDLDLPHYQLLQPYLQALKEMFSLEVFPESSSIWSHHPDTLMYMDTARTILQDLLKA